jgi:hypothetical protein
MCGFANVRMCGCANEKYTHRIHIGLMRTAIFSASGGLLGTL